ncbi:MAG: amidophosphoribosyltransferase, partial [Gemmatimonadetes bacterium]|nr:amidophosphoribosyltransferase [Gemmatimonadota bacterium]
MRHWKEECGVVGIAGTDAAAELVSLALYALQHRGQEGSGIVSFDEGALNAHRGLGLVSDVYTADALAGLDGTIAVGHNRYSTTGSCSAENLQPIVAHSRGSAIALSHNGNLVNALDLRNSLEDQGAIFQTTMDSEVIVHMMARSRQHAFEDRVREALGRVVGAYSVILSDGRKLVGARDPRGFRPLCIGKLGDAHILASESCALDLLGAEYVREVKPGELVVIEGTRFSSIPPVDPVDPKHCIFEYIYFSRPDSVVFGHAVDPVRRRLGQTLAEEHPADADLVIAVPDSSNSAALGFAERSKIPFEIGLIRNHYVGRTFIQPTPRLRDLRVKIKYN